MIIKFKIEPKLNNIKGKVIINRNELETSDFLLNRDFEIEKLLVDGLNMNPSNMVERICLEDSYDYLVNKYTLPEDIETIEINYTGKLTGKTGCYPYVRERISEKFSLLRFETYCYPLFVLDKPRGLSEYLKGGKKLDDIEVDVPVGYDVVSSEKMKSSRTVGSRKIYTFYGDGRFFNATIARYKKTDLISGEFYLLGDNVDEEFIEESLKNAHRIMNKYFGDRDIKSTTKYVVIPDGFGQFVKNETVFITESDLSKKNNIANIIHEFIHLGWNAKVGIEVQRTRFFDEGFTNYFTLRVLEELWNTEDYHNHIEEYINNFNYNKEKLNEIVPVVEFGKHDCGGLSYSIGALLLKELEERIGRETFDEITKKFLLNYKNEEADFELFCQTYQTGSKIKELDGFFNDWLYGTNGYEKYSRI